MRDKKRGKIILIIVFSYLRVEVFFEHQSKEYQGQKTKMRRVTEKSKTGTKRDAEKLSSPV